MPKTTDREVGKYFYCAIEANFQTGIMVIEIMGVNKRGKMVLENKIFQG